MSTVNWAEVLQRLVLAGLPIDGYREDLEALGLDLLDFTLQDAESVAQLWPITRPVGLSLGDRACLSLARRLGLPAFTADRHWATLDLGVEVRLVR
jgi:PIN domain nuclease of toxin-antitoxin system